MTHHRTNARQGASRARLRLTRSCLSAGLAFLLSGCGSDLGFLSELVGGSGDGDGRAVIAIDPNDYCAIDESWIDPWIEFEDEVLRLVNEHRASGADCGSEGSFRPAVLLVGNGRLRCAARNHALDMATRDYFGHVNPEGQRAGDRIHRAGYEWLSWGENIASGQTTPQRVVQSWMESPSHCANMMDPDFTEVGVGYYSGNHWVITFGQPLH